MASPNFPIFDESLRPSEYNGFSYFPIPDSPEKIISLKLKLYSKV